MKVISSAPGKLMLMGEHAAIYGFPCLVTAIDKKITVEADFADDKDIIITPGVNDNRYIKTALLFFRKKYQLNQPIEIKTMADFSDKLGFGSSAATTVAVIKALVILFDIKMTKRQLFDISYQVCFAVQGAGSGFDVAAAVFEGILYYTKKGKKIKSINIDKLPLIIGYSGRKALTTQLIQQVAKQYQSKKKFTNAIFNQIEQIVIAGRRALEKKDFKTFGRLMTENHMLLKELNISTTKLDRMVAAALKAGAYGAKLSGAGGGDCMIALVPSNKSSAVSRALQRSGGEIV